MSTSPTYRGPNLLHLLVVTILALVIMGLLR